MRRRWVVGVALAMLTTLLATGCASGEQMTLDEARAMTETVMKTIADEVPGGTIEDFSAESPYLSCGEGAYTYSARWGVTPGRAFSDADFVRDLPGRLGEDFVVDEKVVDISFPAVALNHASGIILDVIVADVDGAEVVDVYAIAPCATGEPPE